MRGWGLAGLALVVLATPGDARLGGGAPPAVVAPPVTQQLLFTTKPGPYTYQVASVGGAGSANRVIYKSVPTMWPPEPPYSGGGFSIGGADAALFHIDAATGLLSIGAADVAAGTYNINVLVGGAHPGPLVIVLSAAGTQWLEVDNWNPLPGQPVLLTVHNSPNAGGSDVIGFSRDGQWRDDPWFTSAPLPPGTNQTFSHSFVLPDQAADEVLYLSALQAGSAGSIAMGALQLRPSKPITPPPTAPNTLTDPFTPAHTYTVCQSGCNFTDWAAAVAAAADQDFVKITIGQGAYATCTPADNTAESHMPHHLWLQGVGGDFPVIGWVSCVNKGSLVWGNGNTAGDGSVLYVDNLRFTNTACGNDAAVRVDGPGDVFLRNVLVTSICMGILAGDFPGNITIQNSRFSRGGGRSGPSHNIYVGALGDVSTFTMTNTISEQAENGYELKSRAKNTILTCNIFRGDLDVLNVHSSDIHFADGRESHVTNNLIYEGAAAQSGSFAYYFLWGQDRESPLLTNNFMVATGNYFIEDYPVGSGSRYIMLFGNNPTTGPPPGVAASPSPPYTIGPNVYVFAQDGSGPPAGIAQFTGNPSEFVFPGAVIYPTRTAAGLPNITYPVPAACTAPIGNLAIP